MGQHCEMFYRPIKFTISSKYYEEAFFAACFDYFQPLYDRLIDEIREKDLELFLTLFNYGILNIKQHKNLIFITNY